MVAGDVLAGSVTSNDLISPGPRLVPQLSVPDSKDIKAMLNRYGYVPEDKPLLPGMFVRAASLEKLVELAIDLFGECGYF